MSPTASYAWKSLLGAREVIALGSRWRVGLGTHIRIWKDRQWNVPLIDEIFEASEAAIIKKCLSLIDGSQAKGMKLVSLPTHQVEWDLWKGIWEASVPQKIKLFIWKTCKVEHVLIECQFAQEVWGLSPIVNVQQWPSFQNFADVVTHGLQVLNFPDVEIMFTIAWRLWLARNDRIWENHNTLARDICSQVGVLVTEFLDQQQNDSGMLPNAPSKWQPPNAPVYKINVAVSWRKQSRSGSVEIPFASKEFGTSQCDGGRGMQRVAGIFKIT
uniref:Reverse transcriptase zinc-binding domain-containing protein n=1 Tax=Fagus sylvatica TaxID=28930 RepID=A0A2N9HWC5_FAGSY